MSTQDVSGAKEGDARETQVLVQHEHTHWNEVRVTQVVDEAADVAIVTCVYAVDLPVLKRKNKNEKSNNPLPERLMQESGFIYRVTLR